MVQSINPSSFFSNGAIVAWEWSWGRGTRLPAFNCLSVSRSNRPPNSASLGDKLPAVSSGAIAILSCSSMAPVSMPSSISIVVMPVSVSPLMIAHWIGPAPRYFGSREPWTFMQPLGGSTRIAGGRIRPNAATTIKSGFQSVSEARKSRSFIFVGCRTGSCSRWAICFTGEGVRVWPRPFGRSGCVTMPTTWSSDLKSASREGTANSGVPMNTIRMLPL